MNAPTGTFYITSVNQKACVTKLDIIKRIFGLEPVNCQDMIVMKGRFGF